ncbi:hypothetical protein A0O34_05640 [Chryseobacterium glaciei]|uniref:Secretion system C-terminal sorting domain-containing protein n=1 Tax=Chryseobacterium glaciei TaxID=1685010 RepID=A0A172XSP5_9FLAO|nr:T9SS type A sorting domain-containing protein [Chryseobacterium glaciei]ANF50037.1 hypothetical protein A0O34_05640 [Chryseobacterium glaciei]
MKKIYPNPFLNEIIFPLVLNERAVVSIELIDEEGRVFKILHEQELLKGKHKIKITKNQLKSGIYSVKIIIENSKGTSIENTKVAIH